VNCSLEGRSREACIIIDVLVMYKPRKISQDWRCDFPVVILMDSELEVDGSQL